MTEIGNNEKIEQRTIDFDDNFISREHDDVCFTVNFYYKLHNVHPGIHDSH